MATVETEHGRNFEGFENNDREVEESRYQRRVSLLVSVINELVVKLGQLESRTSDLETENLKIKNTQDEFAKLFNLKSQELEKLEKKTCDLGKDNLQLKKKNEELASQV